MHTSARHWCSTSPPRLILRDVHHVAHRPASVTDDAASARPRPRPNVRMTESVVRVLVPGSFVRDTNTRSNGAGGGGRQRAGGLDEPLLDGRELGGTEPFAHLGLE